MIHSDKKNNPQPEKINRKNKLITLTNIKGTFERDGLGIRFDLDSDRVSLFYMDGRPMLEIHQDGDKMLTKLQGKSLFVKQALLINQLEEISREKKVVTIFVDPEEIIDTKRDFELVLVPEFFRQLSNSRSLAMEPDDEGRGGIDTEGRGKIPGDIGWGSPLPENEGGGDIIGGIFTSAVIVFGAVISAVFGTNACEARGGTWQQQPEGGWRCEFN